MTKPVPALIATPAYSQGNSPDFTFVTGTHFSAMPVRRMSQ